MTSLTRYCIKPGYVPRSEATSLETDDSTYWTSERLRSAAMFQYHVYRACRDELRKRPSARLLDLGCGPAIKTREHLYPYADSVTLVDQSSLKQQLTSLIPDATIFSADLDKPLDSLLKTLLSRGIQFDVIICADVIEHLLHPDYCMTLIRDSLAPDGVAFISTPERDILRGTQCTSSPHPAHVREWNSAELKQYLSGHGLKILKHEWLPQKRLSQWEQVAHSLFRKYFCTARWHGCQMAVATHDSPLVSK